MCLAWDLNPFPSVYHTNVLDLRWFLFLQCIRKTAHFSGQHKTQPSNTDSIQAPTGDKDGLTRIFLPNCIELVLWVQYILVVDKNQYLVCSTMGPLLYSYKFTCSNQASSLFTMMLASAWSLGFKSMLPTHWNKKKS